MNLWPHQVRGLAQARDEFKRGNKWVCVVMATGAGKTILGAAAAKAHHEKVSAGKVLWIAHREELIGQAFDTLTEAGLSCGVIQARPCRIVNPYRPVQVASVQTLTARELIVDGVTLFIYDECHHSASEGWSKYALGYKDRGAYGLGLTATPKRSDDLPLGDVYDALVCPITMAELIDQDFLVPYELIRPKKPLKRGQIAQHPVAAYRENAEGRKAIVFASNIVAGTLFRDQFREAGYSAEIITGNTDASTRMNVLERYKRGEIQILTNVGVLTEGFDDRPTSCVILARAVGSVSLYLQMCGRGLRTSPNSGKTNAILIDLYGSSWKHGKPDEDRIYSLDGDGIRRKKLDYGPERFCAICGVSLEPDMDACPECGTEGAGRMAPEVVNAPLVKYARMRQRDDEQRASDLRRWIVDAQVAKHKVGRALYKYKAVYGDWPPDHIKRMASH